MIYLDHNATTPIHAEVFDAMLPFLREDYGNPNSSHPLGRRAREAVEMARAQVASLIGADHPDEIIFTSGGTEASQLAILGGARAMETVPGETILFFASFELEHPATLQPLRRLEQRGHRLLLVPPDNRAVAQIAGLLDLLDSRDEDRKPHMVSLMHAQNETGTIQPVERVGAACRRAHRLFHVDAAQSLGKLPVDVRAIGCDYLTIAGHKIYAPKGIGALYARRGAPLAPVLPGAGQERGMRGGTENVAGIVALGAACRLAVERLANGTTERMRGLKERLWSGLSARVPGVARTADGALTLPNTLHVRFPGVSGNAVLAAAPEILASTGSACHAGSDAPPAAIVALGVAPEDAVGSVRLSLGGGTTAEEVDRACADLAAAYEKARGRNRPETRG